VYYQYWAREAGRLNQMMGGQDRQRAGMLFDASRPHFDRLFFALGDAVTQSRCPLSAWARVGALLAGNIAQIAESRLSGLQAKALARGVLWCLGGDMPLPACVGQFIRAALDLGLRLAREKNDESVEEVGDGLLLSSMEKKRSRTRR
jgi:hypothetical protein